MARPAEARAKKPARARPVVGQFGRWRELITPEGVDLRLRLGDASERAGAFLLDALIVMVSVFVVGWLAFWAVVATAPSQRDVVGQVAGVVFLFALFLSRIGYFIFFELSPRAATPAKRMLGLRVASRNGARLTADAVFARNFMRELEVFVPLSFLLSGAEGVDGLLKLLALVWCGVFVFFPLFNRDRLRVGDLVAGTWVVKAPKRKLVLDLADEGQTRLSAYVFTREQLDAYGIHELHVLEEVLRVKDRKTMAAVALRIRRKIGWIDTPHEHDPDFLSAYYTALRGRLEARLLMGKRRADKYDQD